jgi:large subunit ribosomal protein L15
MALHEVVKIVRHKKRVGRGIGSRGAKSGRGMKGQKSRAGYSRKAGFEGGQTPLYMRLPKLRGAKQKFAPQMDKPVILYVKQLSSFPEGAIVGPGMMRKGGLLKSRTTMVKIIGNDGLSHKLTVRAHAVSAGARALIEKNGGKVELIAKS